MKPAIKSAAVPPQVIFTADDFGRSGDINRAISQAHREGILTSTSLMVGEAGFDEAVELARQMPGLAVGLHVVVSDGRAVLPPRQISRLVDDTGQFPRSPTRAGLRYAFDRITREQLARELRAQSERFASTGLPLSHVDGHMQMHVHPKVFPLLLPLMREFGAQGLRIPRDQFDMGEGRNPLPALARFSRTLVMRLLSNHCLNDFETDWFHRTDWVFGIARSGSMTDKYVTDTLAGLSDGTAEFIFHPTQGAVIDPLGPNPGDLAVLLSPRVRQVIHQRRLKLTSYPLLNDSTPK